MSNKDSSPPKKRPGFSEKLIQEIGKKEGRKLKARREAERNAWFWLGMFGLVGWSVAIPTVIGVAIGLWIDTRWPSRYAWTLMFLFIGAVLGCLNAWYWIKRESRHD